MLAIAAAKAGAHALAVEIDPRPAQIGPREHQNNKVTVRMLTADGYTAALKAGLNDLVFANILMRPLIRLAQRLRARPRRAACWWSRACSPPRCR